MSTPNQKILLDGSQGEGGGSIVRVAAGLTCGIHLPLSVINIRKNRSNPGLRPQHLIGIQALQDLTSGHLSPVEVGTINLDFIPGSTWKDHLNLTIPTAGNIPLLMQTLHNGMYLAPGPTLDIHIQGGGTYGTAAPGTAFVQHVTYALFSKLGYHITLDIIKHGFYPRGGAEAHAVIKPNLGNYKGLVLDERGNLEAIRGKILSNDPWKIPMSRSGLKPVYYNTRTHRSSRAPKLLWNFHMSTRFPSEWE